MSDFNLKMITGNEPPLKTEAELIDESNESELTRLRAENERLKAQQPVLLTGPWTAEKLPKVGDIVVIETIRDVLYAGRVIDIIESYYCIQSGIHSDWISTELFRTAIILPADLLDGRREK